MLTKKDKEYIESLGITEAQVEANLERFRKGFPYLNVQKAALTPSEIISMSSDVQQAMRNKWNLYVKEDHKVVKFVPASGAASRMFKFLYEFLDADYDVPTTEEEIYFFDNIRLLGFFNLLDRACLHLYGERTRILEMEGRYKDIVHALLDKDGLNYGNLPKALILFHAGNGNQFIAAYEQVLEAVKYCTNKDRELHFVFTLSPEYLDSFNQAMKKRIPALEVVHNLKCFIDTTIQKASTNTLAVDMNNQPFRDENGNLLFRPGGHGALIENLNEIDADVVFITNIDNVAQMSLRKLIGGKKKVLGGTLVSLQSELFSALNRLEKGDYNRTDLEEMLAFLNNDLCCRWRGTSDLSEKQLAGYLFKMFNRPIRVCSMVRNVGEPGGGPFVVENEKGIQSLQILESSQINLKDPKMVEIFKSGTHFNPVDMACGLRNYKGNKFDLTQFIDHNAGFISYKSKHGKDLKALELPGLWNGGMSNWITVFIEMPIETFNPVKTVNDLLRPAHRKI